MDTPTLLSLFSALSSIASALVAYAAWRNAQQAKQSSQDSKAIQEGIATALDKFENRLMREGRVLDTDSLRHMKVDMLEAARSMFIEEKIWKISCDAFDAKFRDVDNRLKRNTDLIEMTLNLVFDIMRHLGLKTPGKT